MTVKKILFTDPADPLQRELILQYLEASAARVFCLAETGTEGSERLEIGVFGRLAEFVQEDQLRELALDEVWRSARPGLRVEQHLQDIRQLLKAIARAGIPVINYLASEGLSWETRKAAVLLHSSEPSRLAVDLDREIESEFVMAKEKSGLGYRIFKPQNLIDARGNFPYPQANKLYNLLGEIVSLKEEVEDKSDGYFSRHCLRVDGTICLPLLSLTQAAEAIFKIAAEATTLNGLHGIAGPSGVTLRDFLDQLSESMGIKIEPQSESTKLNPIDRLLNDRISLARALSDTTQCLSHSSDIEANLPDNDLIIRSFMSAYSEQMYKEAGRIERARQALQPRTIEKENADPLCYYVGGAGERSIVIVNAYGQGLAYWTRVVADLVENFRVIIWLPRSSRYDTVGVTKSYPVVDHREDLKELLTHEQVRKAEFVGWCTGPKLILDYYVAYPDDVASMIFLGATFKDWPSKPQSDTEYEKNLAPLLKMVHQRPQLAAPLIDSLRKVLLARNGDGRSLDADDPNSDKEVMKMLGAPCSDLKQAVIEPLLSEASVISYSEQLLDFWNHDVTTLFERVRVPVLFISGECDQIAHPQMAKAAAQMIPGARRLEVRGGSHYLLYERSSLTSSLLDLFWWNCQNAQLVTGAAAQ
jgi:pimeloyl-ACP methyl ester carboxylesterase